MKRQARTARSFIDQPLSAETDVHLGKTAGHHLSTVLRAKAGDHVMLFNGDGNNYKAELIQTGKQTTAHIHSSVPGQCDSALELSLVQCISRGDRMDTAVQKATELGVTRIQPVYSRHSIARLEASRALKKQEHWRAITISACEQSGRCRVPTVHPAISLAEYLQQLDDMPADADVNVHRLVLSPTGANGLQQLEGISNAAVLIGPETGLDGDEVEAAIANGFQAIQLGSRILRTETAAPAIIAILQARFGDIG